MATRTYENMERILCDELEKFVEKGKIGSAAELENVLHLIKGIKYLGEIEEMESEADYSEARGRRNARRDSRGRYVGDYDYRYDDRYDARYDDRDDRRYVYHDGKDGMTAQLRAMMDSAKDEATRSDIKRLIEKMERA